MAMPKKKAASTVLIEVLVEPMLKPSSRPQATWYVKLAMPERTRKLAASKKGM